MAVGRTTFSPAHGPCVAATDMVRKPFGPIRPNVDSTAVTPRILVSVVGHWVAASPFWLGTSRRVFLKVSLPLEATGPNRFGARVLHYLRGHASPVLELTLLYRCSHLALLRRSPLPIPLAQCPSRIPAWYGVALRPGDGHC